MIKLTFKNVGQGDSIILEYERKNQQRISVIDCKSAYRTNPVLEHIKSAGYKAIDYLILSHPHTDHFSGYVELLRYCIDNKITIKYFAHTSTNMPGFWKMAARTASASSEILKLFHIIREAASSLGMKHCAIQGESLWDKVTLREELSLQILAPTSRELDSYAVTYDDDPKDEEDGNGAKGNLLSTLIKLSDSGDWFVLLCSDVNKDVLKYYGVRRPDVFRGKLILGQSPHHGSFHNHKNAFWKGLKKEKNCPIVFSVGHNKHKHPSDEVIKFFIREGFEIYSTNNIGYLKEISESAAIKKTVSHLDTFGMVMPSARDKKFSGDKIFEISTDGVITIK